MRKLFQLLTFACGAALCTALLSVALFLAFGTEQLVDRVTGGMLALLLIGLACAFVGWRDRA